MMAASEFVGAKSEDLPMSTSMQHRLARTPGAPSVQVIVDIEQHDWEFEIQAGAFRRVIMNLFGNSIKYTKEGYILVQLKVLGTPADERRQTISLRIKDSGKGMSPEYCKYNLCSRAAIHPTLSFPILQPNVASWFQGFDMGANTV